MKATPTSITQVQKLNAMSMRIMGAQWYPRAGDFYTSALTDLDLYRIVEIENNEVRVENCANPGVISVVPVPAFVHPKEATRVWVPSAILEYVQ